MNEGDMYENKCLYCKRHLGNNNSRQLCNKTSCPYEDLYFQKKKSLKDELSKRYIEKDWGMFRERGCVAVNKMIMECDNYNEACYHLDYMKFNKFTTEAVDAYVHDMVYKFYIEVDELLTEYMIKSTSGLFLEY